MGRRWRGCCRGGVRARGRSGWRSRRGRGGACSGRGSIRVTGEHPFVCAQACMVTMAYGEGVLVTGAVLNALLADLAATALARPGTLQLRLDWVLERGDGGDAGRTDARDRRATVEDAGDLDGAAEWQRGGVFLGVGAGVEAVKGEGRGRRDGGGRLCLRREASGGMRRIFRRAQNPSSRSSPFSSPFIPSSWRPWRLGGSLVLQFACL